MWCLQGGGENLRGFFKVPSLFGIRSGLHFMILCIPTSTLREADSVSVDNNLASLMITWWSAWITLNHILLLVVVYSMFSSFLQIPTHPVTDAYFCSSGFYLENVPKSVKVIARQLDKKTQRFRWAKPPVKSHPVLQRLRTCGLSHDPAGCTTLSPLLRQEGSWQQHHVETIRQATWQSYQDTRGRAYVPAKSLQSCPTLCDPMDCSPPGSSVHGLLQARILEWVAMPSSRGPSQPSDRTSVSLAPALQADSLLLSHQGSPHGTAVMT